MRLVLRICLARKTLTFRIARVQETLMKTHLSHQLFIFICTMHILLHVIIKSGFSCEGFP